MKRKVVLSKIAEEKLSDVLDYLLNRWSNRVKQEFIRKLDQSVSVIQEHPESFPPSLLIPTLRKCVVTKQISIFYEFDDENI
ncbi:hypothetical protein GCM10009117_00270 [Gangjinia marincola]|uniref:Plasmid stabilization system n=1 Tax=Gangjinia marincola TaxID=578463 RepID=A0ABN1MCQ6_9FLAO